MKETKKVNIGMFTVYIDVMLHLNLQLQVHVCTVCQQYLKISEDNRMRTVDIF